MTWPRIRFGVAAWIAAFCGPNSKEVQNRPTESIATESQPFGISGASQQEGPAHRAGIERDPDIGVVPAGQSQALRPDSAEDRAGRQEEEQGEPVTSPAWPIDQP